MKQRFSASVWQEGEWYIAQALEVDVASQGQSEGKALANLQDALALYFSPPSPAPLPQIHHIEVEIGAA